MPEAPTRCTNCGKDMMPKAQLGTITGYIIRHKFCSCDETKRLSKYQTVEKLCANCHKQIEDAEQKGSFISFIFLKARCQCPRAKQSSGDGALQAKSNTSNAAANKLTANTGTANKHTTNIHIANKRTAQQRKSAAFKLSPAASMTAATELTPGSIIGGNFEVKERIGWGGMGIVLRARHNIIGTDYALKVLTPALINEQTWSLFQSEARTMGRLTHPTFVKVYDLGLHGGTLPFYTMDLLSGQSLEAAIIEHGNLNESDTIEIFLQVLDGLAYAHRNGIIHRDLKPSNIMLCPITADGASSLQVKLLDFGIAKSINKSYGNLHKDISAKPNETQSADAFGSPVYMSPEQSLGSAVDQRTDIYSIGCCLFETLTGFVPFDAQSTPEISKLHQYAEPPKLADALPQKQFTQSIEHVVQKCLAKSPDDRYQSAKELAIDLHRIREGKDLTAYKSTISGSGFELSPRESNSVIEVSGRARIAILATVIVAVSGAAYSIFGLPYISESSEKNGTINNTKTADGLGTARTDNKTSSSLPVAKIKAAFEQIDATQARLTFTPDILVGQLVTERPPQTYELRGELRVPLDRHYELRPVSPESGYLDALKTLDITDLVINDAKLKNYDKDLVDKDNAALTANNKIDMAPYCKTVGRLFPITRVKLCPSIVDYSNLLSNFPKIKTLCIARPESTTVISKSDSIFLSDKLHRLDLIDVESCAPWLDTFTSAKNIDHMEVTAATLTQSDLEKIKDKPKLKKLTIAVPAVTDSVLVSMLNMSELSRLKINYNPAQLGLISKALHGKTQLKNLTFYKVTDMQKVAAQIAPLQNGITDIKLDAKELYQY